MSFRPNRRQIGTAISSRILEKGALIAYRAAASRAEAHHDFSKENSTLADKLTHLLYHLKEQRNDILVLLSGESGDLFLQYFKTASRPLFTEYAASASPSVPEDFALNHYVSSFAEAVKWWAGGGMRISPEKVVAYYLALIK